VGDDTGVLVGGGVVGSGAGADVSVGASVAVGGGTGVSVAGTGVFVAGTGVSVGTGTVSVGVAVASTAAGCAVGSDPAKGLQATRNNKVPMMIRLGFCIGMFTTHFVLDLSIKQEPDKVFCHDNCRTTCDKNIFLDFRRGDRYRQLRLLQVEKVFGRGQPRGPHALGVHSQAGVWHELESGPDPVPENIVP
jgi:hypothetical protein